MRQIYVLISAVLIAFVWSGSAEATKQTPPWASPGTYQGTYQGTYEGGAQWSSPNITCANVRCGSGTYCAERPGGPVCEPLTSAPSCASTLCQVGNQCIETSSGPQCVPTTTPSYPAPPSQPTYPSYPSQPAYPQQSCAYGGYYHYGQLICYPPPAWRNPYQYGWGQYYNPPPRYVPRPRPVPRPTPRPPWHPQGPDMVEPETPPRFCTMEYDPVCAEKPVVCVRAPCPSNRKTFGNSCQAKQDGYTVLYKGQCR